MMQYRSQAASRTKAQNQAMACQMFREGQRGQDIMRRAQAQGCPIPPEAMMHQGAFDAAVAESC